MDDDAQLLRRFVENGSEDAFAALVERHLNLVYSAALRQVGGDAHLAWDATQSVFLALAQNSRRLAPRVSLVGWLYTATRFTTAKIVRTRRRDQARALEAHAMQEILHHAAPEPDWQELRGVLDGAMHELRERERDAILARHFEGHSFAEIGARYELSENAARMRVERAMEKLRGRLARRGITSTAAALSAVLSSHAVASAPAGLAAAAVSFSIAGVSATGAALSWNALGIMGMTKAKTAAVLALVAAGIGSGVLIQHRATAALTSVVSTTEQQARAIVAWRAEIASATEMNERLAAARNRPAGRANSAPGAVNALAATLARLQVLIELKSRGLTNISTPFFVTMPQTQGLHPTFIELFSLTPPEVDAVQAAWQQARARITELALANATTRRTLDGKFLIEIGAFDGGGPIYDRLMDAIAATLGPERTAAFIALVSDGVGFSLNQFGAERRTITVTRGPDATEGGPTYFIADRRMFHLDPATSPLLPDPARPGTFVRGGASGSDVKLAQPLTRDQLIERYGPFGRLVPLSL